VLVLAVISVWGAKQSTDSSIYSLRKTWQICGSRPSHYSGVNDLACSKRFANTFDRAWTCRTRYSQVPQGYLPSTAAASRVSIDRTALKFVDPSVDVTVVHVIRDARGVPHYKYFSNQPKTRTWYPWSSVKYLAVSAAAQVLQRACGSVSLSELKEANTGIPLSDLATVITTYQQARFSSNSLAAYFKSIAGVDEMNKILKEKLGLPEESFENNWGGTIPSELGFTFVKPDGTSCSVPNRWKAAGDSAISGLALNELFRRIVHHNDIPESHRLQIGSSTVADLLFGAPASESKLFPKLQYGGLSHDTSIFIQQGLESAGLSPATMDSISAGEWRIFAKYGFGTSETRGTTEMVIPGYACVPYIDNRGNSIPNKGLEFFVTVYQSAKQSPTTVDSIQSQVFRSVIQWISQLETVGPSRTAGPAPGPAPEPSSSAPSGTTWGRPRADSRCGAAYGNAGCLRGHCCSKFSWCGTSDDHCASGIQF